MYSVEEHKIRFNQVVLSYQIKKAKNNRILSLAYYRETLQWLKELERPEATKSLADFNLLRRFAILRVEVGGNIVEKLVKPGTNLRFVPHEELFDAIHEAHVEKGHSGRDIMSKYM